MYPGVYSLYPKSVRAQTSISNHISRGPQVLRRVDSFECQHIATTAWAFAQYDWAPQDVLQALANEAARRGSDMRPQHISMLLQVPTVAAPRVQR